VTLVLWSFYSPDAGAMAAELAAVRAAAPEPAGSLVLHVAGGVHATAEPQHVLDCGWDLAAIGEREATILALVRALRDGDGVALRTPQAPQLPLDAFLPVRSPLRRPGRADPRLPVRVPVLPDAIHVRRPVPAPLGRQHARARAPNGRLRAAARAVPHPRRCRTDRSGPTLCCSKIGFCVVSCVFLEFMRLGRTR